MRLLTKRIYEPSSPGDGYRVLVDRLWPRGVSKDHAKLDAWEKNLSPGDELRKWFQHDPERWEEFRRRYRKELNAKKGNVSAMLEHATQKTITLLFGARDTHHNNAIVLKEFIEEELSADCPDTVKSKSSRA